MTTSRRVIVTDAHATSTLAVVRSLGRAGALVTVVGEASRFNLAAHSKYAHSVRQWPAAEDEPAAYLDHLETELRTTRYDLLIPTTDTTVTLAAHRRAVLDPLVRIALPANDVLGQALDKAITLNIAAEQGVACPPSYVFASLEDAEKAAPALTYPCIVKPRFSRRWTGTGPMSRGAVSVVVSRASLLQTIARGSRPPDELIVQDIVNGTGVGVFALLQNGDPLFVFAHRRLREANPLGGRAALAESIAPDQRIVEPALRLLKAMRWSGVAMVEFKDPGHPLPPVLMEVNGRFWGSLPLAIASGADFPHWLVELMLTGRVVTPSGYSTGVRCRHLKSDLSYLVAALKGRPEGWLGDYPTRLGALLDTVGWPGRWRPYNLRLEDPAPAILEAVHFARSELTRKTGRANAVPAER